MTRVLVAEDNEDIQNLLKIYIKRSGADVEIASNSQEVVLMASSNPYDLVLIDIEMPIINGVETAKMLKSNGCTLPLYAFTANDAPKEVLHYLALGFTGYLKKPIDQQQLNNIIQLYHDQENKKPSIPPILTADNPLKDDEDIGPLIEGFLERLPSTISKMEYALQRLDWDSLMSYSHQLKGAAGGFGYPNLTELAAILEKTLKNAEFHKAQGNFDSIKFYVLGD